MTIKDHADLPKPLQGRGCVQQEQKETYNYHVIRHVIMHYALI